MASSSSSSSSQQQQQELKLLLSQEELLEMPSPSHVGLQGHHHHHLQPHHHHDHHHEDGFSPEDIHHLLGDVLGDDHDEDDDDEQVQQGGEDQASHHSNHNNPTSSTGSEYGGASYSSTNNDRSLLRTERKRTREKQRRSDVNKQFQQLTSLLRKLETEDPDEFSQLPPYSPANRVELMGRTIQLLTVLYDRNKKRKTEIVDLQQKLEAAQKAGEETAAKLKESMMAPQAMGGNKVMMMVPMLINTGTAAGSVAASNDGSQPVQHQPQPAAMPFQPWMSNFMGMPTEAQPMAAAAAMAAPQHAMHMPFFMPMAAPPMTTATTMTTTSAPSQAQTTPTVPSSAPMNVAPSASSGDLKQEAKVGSNLAHCA